MPDDSDYAVSVFINCPFSDDYTPIMRAITFAVVDCGYKPRCALEVEDSGEYRLDKINTLIECSRFGIHDLTNMKLDEEHRLPRFNMPLELGLFLGAKRFSAEAQQRDKRTLVLDIDRYRYQKAISDISGQDIQSHNGDPGLAITRVRNWLNTQSGSRHLPGAATVRNRYSQYEDDLPVICKDLELEPEELTFIDLWRAISYWQERSARNSL